MTRQMSQAEWMGAYGHLIPAEIQNEGHLSLNFQYESEDGSESEAMHQRIEDDGDIWFMARNEEKSQANDGWDFL